jgi:hypothetical protein
MEPPTSQVSLDRAMSLRFVFALFSLSVPLVSAPRTQAQASASLAALPGWFEPNAGQFSRATAFFSRGSSGQLLVQKRGATFHAAGRALELRWNDANAQSAPRGAAPLGARSSYFTGADPGRWARGIAQYARVEQRGLYRGVDLVYYLAEKQVEFDLVVAPGSDPNCVQFSFSGARPVHNQAGELVFTNGMIQRRPVAFQETADGRRAVPVSYRIAANGQVGFAVGPYDRAKPLVIDPVLYAGFLGGDSNEMANAVAVDNKGNVWITGSSSSTVTLPPQFAPIQDAPKGGRDAFLAKLTPDSSGKLALAYWTQLGGAGNDEATAITVDDKGFVYIAGQTTSNDLPRAGAALQDNFAGETDAFVAKIRIEDSGIDALWFSQYYGGLNVDIATSVAVDAESSIYIAGYTNSGALPGSQAQVVQCCNRGGYEGFMAKILPGAPSSALAYGTFLGGSSTDIIRAMTVDPAGNVYIAGYTSSEDFPVTVDAYQSGLRSGIDMFLVKLDFRKPLLDALVYGTFAGGSALDSAQAIALDAAGGVWVAGYTDSPDFPITPHAYNTGRTGETDLFLVHFDLTKGDPSQSLVYSTYLGGGSSEVLYSMALAPGGTVALAGYTYSEDFPQSTAGGRGVVPGNGADAFVLQVDPSRVGRDAIVYSAVMGGKSTDAARGIAVDARGNLYAAGSTLSADFPSSDGSTKLTPGGATQSFVIGAVAPGPPPAPAQPAPQ